MESNTTQESEGSASPNRELHKPLSRFALAGYSTFALSMLGIGFYMGWNHQVKKYSEEGGNGLLLGERMKHRNDANLLAVSNLNSRRVVKPSSPPVILATKALGIATIICLSSATLISLGVAWYMEISSFQQFSDRLKVIMPEKSKALQHQINPTLFRIKGGLQWVFGSLEPVLVKRKQQPTQDQKEQEKRELQAVGLNEYLLDESELYK